MLRLAATSQPTQFKLAKKWLAKKIGAVARLGARHRFG